jgi:hypothetical protein
MVDTPQLPLTALEQPPPTDSAMKEEYLESKHFDAIGKVAVSWSYLEASIDSACVDLLEIDDRKGVCLTSQIAGASRKLDAFLSLARLLPVTDPIIRRMNKLYDDVRQKAEVRNRIIHDPWVFDHLNAPLTKRQQGEFFG